MRVEREIHIAASPERVYEVVMDPWRLEEWVTIHAELAEAPSGELREGSELTQSLKIAGQRFNVTWTVAHVDRPNRVVWEGRGPVRSSAQVVYELQPDGEGTRFTYGNEYRLPGGPLGRLAGRAMGGTSVRESERSLQRLKTVIEG